MEARRRLGIRNRLSMSGRSPLIDNRFRIPRVGDRVRLLSFGSIGIVDQIKDDEAEVRVGSLHLREKLENLETVDEVNARRVVGGSPTRGLPTGSPDGLGVVREGSGSDKTREALRRAAQTTEVHLHS